MMVAGGLLAGLAIGGIKLFDNQSKAQKTVEANHEITTIIHEMRTILGKQINCTASFAGIDVDTGVTTKIKKETSPGVFDELFVQDIIQPNNISVKGYRFHRNNPGLAQDEGLILISFSRGKSTIKDRTEKLLKYTFTKDANNKILTCTVTNELLTDLWKKSPDDPLNIYYNMGSVVVGSTDPDNSAAFEINSTEKGFLPPRLTTDQRSAISNPATGLLVFDTDENTYYFWDGSAWVLLGGQDNIVFY